jgi:hypothetical protein
MSLKPSFGELRADGWFGVESSIDGSRSQDSPGGSAATASVTGADRHISRLPAITRLSPSSERIISSSPIWLNFLFGYDGASILRNLNCFSNSVGSFDRRRVETIYRVSTRVEHLEETIGANTLENRLSVLVNCRQFYVSVSLQGFLKTAEQQVKSRAVHLAQLCAVEYDPGTIGICALLEFAKKDTSMSCVYNFGQPGDAYRRYSMKHGVFLLNRFSRYLNYSVLQVISRPAQSGLSIDAQVLLPDRAWPGSTYSLHNEEESINSFCTSNTLSSGRRDRK